MLHTRLWMGSVLIVLTAGMLLVDRWLAPWFPFLFFVVVGLAVGGCIELLRLLNSARRSQLFFCLISLVAVLATNWLGHVAPELTWPMFDSFPGNVLIVFVVAIAAAVLLEMIQYRGEGGVTQRLGITLFVVVYLGVLPSFLAQLRWLGSVDFGLMAVALTIFVPKCCDIGAYLTGRAIGRHKMTPTLSPKKTWEGAAGGLVLASAVAIGLDRFGPASPLGGDWRQEIAFGLVLGVVGMFGDLAESLIKRDSGQKDASQAVPGFGGVLDVIDSLVFAGPVAYVWFSRLAG